MLVWLGSAGAGLVWGWYAGPVLAVAPHERRVWLAYGGATALFVVGAMAAAGWTSALVVCVAALAGGLLFKFWRASLGRHRIDARKDLHA